MKTDGRVRYTRMVIKESLLKLLAAKPVQKITVKEICELAEINRATFYTHYADPFDLLEHIENELFEDVFAGVPVTPASIDTDQVTREIFRLIEKNAALCKVLFSENGDRMFLRRILDGLRDKMIADWQRQHPQASRQQLIYLYAFVIGGAVSVIEEWVRTGMKDTPLPLIDISQKVIDMWVDFKAKGE